MRVVKILGVVFGALLLLTGIGLLAGSAVVGSGEGEFDKQLAEQGLAGPATGRVTAVDGTIYTVDYTDKNGSAQTGSGPVADGTAAPAQGQEVQVYYSTVDPAQIIILDFPGGNFAQVARILRTVGIVCVVLGALLLLAGIVALATARNRPPVAAGPGANPGGEGAPPPPQSGQVPQEAGHGSQDPGYGPPPGQEQAYQDQGYPPTPTGPDVDPTPTHAFPQDPTQSAPPPETNRPG